MWGTPCASRRTVISSPGPASVTAPSYFGSGARMMATSTAPAMRASATMLPSGMSSQLRILRLVLDLCVVVDMILLRLARTLRRSPGGHVSHPGEQESAEGRGEP